MELEIVTVLEVSQTKDNTIRYLLCKYEESKT